MEVYNFLTPRWRSASASAPSRFRAVFADHRSRIIREHARHRREVADIAIDDAEQRDDRRLVRRDAVEVRFVDYRFLKSISFRM